MNKYLDEITVTLQKVEITDEHSNLQIKYDESCDFVVSTFKNHRQRNSVVFFIGNGGSAAIASHMTADFMKNGGMKTYSLYDSSVMTCMGNDYGYEEVFSRPLDMLVNEGDLLVAISSSGESKNIINAIEVTKKNKAKVITFTGFEPDNTIRGMGDLNVYVPCKKYGIVESIHNLILQQVVDELVENK